MNDITIFNHLGNDIRVMTDEQGEPLFVRRLDAEDVSQTDALILTGRRHPRRITKERREATPLLVSPLLFSITASRSTPSWGAQQNSLASGAGAP